MALPTTVQARVHPRLLNEISRFFGGWLPTLREVFQNAWRAGAKTVTITADPDGALIGIADDGAGCPDPALLLSAGETGWDEDTITDPAGLGFFSLLNPELFAQVEVESCGWKVTLNPLTATKEPIPVRASPVTTGLQIRLLARDKHRALDEDLQEARGYYPFQVMFNGEPVPPQTPPSDLMVETSAGRVHWSASGRLNYRLDRGCTAVWEHRAIHSPLLYETLLRAAQGDDLLEALLRHSSAALTWFIEPGCGVRPKLPDRNELAQSAQLESAARRILEAVRERLMAIAREASTAWPRQFTDIPHGLPRWMSPLSDEVVTALGWTRERVEDAASFTVYDDGDGYTTDWNRLITVYDRDPVTVPAEDLPTLLHAYDLHLHSQGVSESGGQPVAVRLKGLRKKEAHIWLASSITWNGHALPFYLVPDGHDQLDCWLVIAGEAEAALQQLRDGPYREVLTGWLLQRAAEANQLWSRDWITHDGDYELDWGRAGHDAIVAVTEAYAPATRRRRQREIDRITEAQQRLGAALQQLEVKARTRPQAFTCQLKAVDGDIARIVRLAKAAQHRVAARLKQLQAVSP